MTETERRTPGDRHDAHNPMREGAAVFLGQVLGLSDSATNLAGDLSSIKQDVNASVYTIQLESSIGPAAFLVYAYVLGDRGGEGHTGKELFDAGLETLQQAAQRSSPGPRAVAHAETDTHAFILATTPGTYRALTGAPDPPASLEATPADLPPTGDALQIRRDTAQNLLATLRSANAQATEWLAALQVSTEADSTITDGDTVGFSDEETELALYLLDDASIGNLLRALNLLVSTAQQQAAAALEDDVEHGDTWS
ncbi:MAG: hypothetical protein M3440_05480 [Chloroflexota bacterium]|nr:hypothetical protein [Chloroflexota bacterium]